MKRILSILIVLMSLIPLFAGQQIGRFDFSAYYNGREQQQLWTQINIFDGTSSTQNAGIINLANPEIGTEQSQGFSETVFRWEYSGNYNCTAYIKFTFLPLQAYRNGMYYIPEHSFTVHINQTTFTNLQYPQEDMSVHLRDNMYSRYNDDITTPSSNYPGPQTVEFGTKTSGNYPYPAPYDSKGLSVQLGGAVLRNKSEEGQNAGTTLPDTSQWSNSIWTRSGTCVLTIGDYEDADGVYDYIANITVTCWVDK